MPLQARLSELLAADQSSGRFASPDDNLDDTRNDSEAVLAWLQKHKDTPNTLRAYMRHVEVLLTWLQRNGLCLTDLTRPKAREFIDFCKAPPTDDIGRDKLFRPVMDDGKPPKPVEPIRAVTSPAARNQRLAALNSLFKHMVESGYARANPFAGINSEARNTDLVRRFRSLDESMFQAVIEEIEALKPVEQARMKLLIVGMTRLAARRGEASIARLCDIQNDGKGRWWWFVTGKGQKPAMVPVHPDILEALAAYRAAIGRPSAWGLNDESPLFPGARGEAVGDNTHYICIKALFKKAALRIGGAQSDRLMKASPHWLRHTGLSRLVELMPIHKVKEIARHGRVDTTATYTTVGADELHEDNKNAPNL